MIVSSISNFRLLEISDEDTGDIYYGSNQQWYTSWWRRYTGCGPSTFSNIICYLDRRNVSGSAEKLTKKDMLFIMNDVWRFLTPTHRGIPSAGTYISGAEAYISHYKRGISPAALDVPGKGMARPALADLISFLESALSCDIPAAFLSLDNGDEKLLDTWHWVTLISLDTSSAFAEIIDNGKLLKVDLRKWLLTTSRGGGFVGFSQND